jgi:nitroreductase
MPATTDSRHVMDVIAGRTSCRAYAAVPVRDADVRQILEAARLAPSACNQQPWRFAVVRDPQARRKVVEQGFLPGIRMDWALEAPVLVVLGMETSFLTHKLGALVSGVKYPWVDIGIAGEHLVLAAAELGLGTCWIGWIRPKAVQQAVGWPRSVKPVAVITVGHPQEGTLGPLPSSHRKPLEDLVRWL